MIVAGMAAEAAGTAVDMVTDTITAADNANIQ